MNDLSKPPSKAVAKTGTMQAQGEPQADASGRMSELRATANMMRLEPGLYCVIVSPSPAADANTGLPGVRINHAPGPAGRPEAVEIRTIADDGWVSGFGDAALVKVAGGSAHVMVTIYEDPRAGRDAAPNVQVMPLLTSNPAAPTKTLPQAATAPLAPPAPETTAPAAPMLMDVLAHIRKRGDVGAKFGDWLGDKGSGLWVEGCAIAPTNGIPLSEIEYQVVLGRGWMSPWVEGGQYAGSRGMNLPILGLRIRLLGDAAKAFDLRYSATFVDGSAVGPVASGEACEAPSLAAVEAILIEITPQGLPKATAPKAPARGRGKPI
jgi:hypothetical protein